MAKLTRLANLHSSGGLRALGQIRSNGGTQRKRPAAGSNGNFEAAVKPEKMIGFKSPLANPADVVAIIR